MPLIRDESAKRASRLTFLVELAVLAAVYVAAGKLGLQLAFVNASATAVWPATGIAIAALLLFGNRAWPAIFAGAFAVNLTTAGTPLTTLGIATGNTLEGLVGAALVRRFAGGRLAFERAQHVFSFAGCVLAAAAVSATIGTTSLALTGFADWVDYGAVWLTWWLGDVAGALIVAPLILLWVSHPSLVMLRRRLPEALGLVLVTASVALVVFGGDLVIPGLRNAPLAFLAISPLIWAVFRFGSREGATLIVLLAVCAIAGTLKGYGPFALVPRNESLLFLQAFMATIAVTTLAVGALVGERARSEAARDELQAATEHDRSRLEAVVRHMPLGVIVAEAPSGRLIVGNEEAERLWRHPFRRSQSIEAYSVYRGFHRDGRPYEPEEWPLARSILSGEVVSGEEIEVLRGDDTRGTLSVSSAPILDGRGRVIAGVVIFHDVTLAKEGERRAADLLELEQRARAQAEGANRAKDEFLAMLGHELRNPLGAISAAAAVLQVEDGTPAHHAQARDVIARQVRHVARLLDDLLEVGRVTSGQIVLRRQAVDLATVAQRALEAVRTRAGSEGPTIRAQLEPTWVDGDPTRLEQVVTNLLTNAARYTPRDGRIELTVRRHSDTAVLMVRDTGIGISADLLPRVFDLFVQGERPLDRWPGGLGIGLTLVRHLATLHGGRVEAASDGEGRGATFTVRLPACPPAETAVAAPPAGAKRPRRVLVVEDNQDSAEMLRVLLEMNGSQVHVAHGGTAGVDMATRLQPDVAFVDIGLPHVDGYDVARALRRDPRTRGTRLVALTGYGQPEDVLRAREAGFDMHLVKPVDPARVIEVLQDSATHEASRDGR